MEDDIIESHGVGEKGFHITNYFLHLSVYRLCRRLLTAMVHKVFVDSLIKLGAHHLLNHLLVALSLRNNLLLASKQALLFLQLEGGLLPKVMGSLMQYLTIGHPDRS